MRASVPRLTLALGLLAAASSPAGAVDVPARQVQIEARIAEVSRDAARELGFNWRLGSDGKPDLLLTTPAAVGGQQVDGVEVALGKSIARALDAILLPPGWRLRADGPRAVLGGPAVAGAERLAFAFDCDRDLRLLVNPEVTLSAHGQPVLRMKVDLQPLDPVQLTTDLSAVVRLPQRISPGDVVRFVPLDPRFTPGVGEWRIGGVVARWNGDRERPVYEFTVPEGFGESAGDDWHVRVTYTDPWGTKLVDGRTTDCHFGPAPPPAETPQVAACSPAVLEDAPFCVCGSFPEGSAAELTLNDRPIGKYLVASSPTILHFDLPSDFASGPLDLDAAQTSSFGIADGVRSVLVRVRAAIDRAKLRRGESTDVELALEGTDRPVGLRLTNVSPGIVTLEGGNDQIVTTSGGRPNRASRAVHAVSLGDFTLEYELEVGACPCADVTADDDARAPREDTDSIYDDFGPSETVDHQEMESERAITVGTVAVWREKRDRWWERAQQVECRDEEAEKLIEEIRRATEELEKFLAEVWPKVEQLRLEIDLLPAGEAAAQRAISETYSELGRILEGLSAFWLDLALLPRCEDVTHGDEVPVSGEPAGEQIPDLLVRPVPPGGGATTSERTDDGVSPGRCGPDLTAAFDALLERTVRRIAMLPASEHGEEGGEAFLKRNAPASWFDSPGDAAEPIAPAGGPSFLAGPPSAKHSLWSDGNDPAERLVWWPAEPIVIGGPCASLDSPCQETAWLWGRCLPVELISSFYSGFVERQLGTDDPDPDDERGSGPLSPFELGAMAGTVAKFAGIVALQGDAAAGDLAGALHEQHTRMLEQWLSGLKVGPFCLACEPCPGFESTLALDWTLRDWLLSAGRVQKPDGTIEEQTVM